MILKKNKYSFPVFFCFFLLLVCLILSLFLYSFSKRQMVKRVFFFPNLSFTHLGKEFHYIPHFRTLKKNIESVVKESLLGPIKFDLSSLFNSEASIRQISLVGDTLYLDLSIDALNNLNKNDEEKFRFFSNRLRALRKNIRANFRKIQNLIITVDGQEVHSLYYREEI